jgi:hypothetical protein
VYLRYIVAHTQQFVYARRQGTEYPDRALPLHRCHTINDNQGVGSGLVPANNPPTDFGVQEAAGAALGYRNAAKAQVSGPQRRSSHPLKVETRFGPRWDYQFEFVDEVVDRRSASELACRSQSIDPFATIH